MALALVMEVTCSYVGQGVLDVPLHQVADLVKDIESSFLWEKYLVVCSIYAYIVYYNNDIMSYWSFKYCLIRCILKHSFNFMFPFMCVIFKKNTKSRGNIR